MDFSASAATKDAARLRRRRFCTPPRFFSTLPNRILANARSWSHMVRQGSLGLGAIIRATAVAICFHFDSACASCFRPSGVSR